MPAQFEYDHLLHPITLDSAFQSFITAINGSTKSLLPTSIESITISPNLPKGAGAEFCGFTKVFRKGFREYGGSVVFSDDTWSGPKIVVKGMVGTEVGVTADAQSSNKQKSSIRKMCAEMIWKEDVDHVRQVEAEQLFQPSEEAIVDHSDAYEKAVGIYTVRTLSSLTPETEAALPSHLSQYVKWLKQQSASSDSTGSASNRKTDDKFLTGVAEGSVEGRLLCAIGEKLPEILSGSTPPLPIMTEDNKLFNLYSNDPTVGMLTQWLDLQGHKRPDYKILEVGAGTGSLTLPALEMLGGRYGSTPRFSQYCFTDSDPSCFENAQSLLKDWQSHIDVKKFNIEGNLGDQDFKEGSFDMIIAANVSHLS